MSILFLNIRNWLITDEGRILTKYGSVLGFIAALLLIAVALMGGFFLAYVGTEVAAATGWSVGGAG